jgi:hypothetical protein
LTAIADMPAVSKPRITASVKAEILGRYKDEPAATPTLLAREYGISRNTIHRWLEVIKRHPPVSDEPLRVQAPETIRVKPCPSCGTSLRVDLSDQELLDHFSACAPGIDRPASPRASQIAPGSHRGQF